MLEEQDPYSNEQLVVRNEDPEEGAEVDDEEEEEEEESEIILIIMPMIWMLSWIVTWEEVRRCNSRGWMKIWMRTWQIAEQPLRRSRPNSLLRYI